MRTKSSLNLLWKLSSDFFSPIGGSIEKIYYINRKNFEIQNPKYKNILACTVFIRFSNKTVFGEKDYDFYDVYRIYRQMRHDWWDYLDNHGIPIFNTASQIVPLFFPLLSSKAHNKGKYPSQKEEAYGCELISINDLIQESRYYKSLKVKYELKYALKEQNDIVIGPDGGLLAALAATIKAKKSLNNFIDIGAGTGELSAYAIKKGNCRYIFANDYSPILKKHLYSYVGNMAKKKKTIFKLQIKNALNFNFPNVKKIDAISIGIFYGAQPSFITKYGLRLKNILSPDGILFIQSGQLEGLFNLSLIHPCIPESSELENWPWYKSQYNLGFWFGKNVTSLVMHGEIVTLASSSSTVLSKVVQLARKNGATDLMKYEQYEFK